MFDSYLYLGHGTDLCDADGNLIVKKVPPGNLYITASICGQTNALFYENLLKAFAKKENEDVWRNPDLLGLKRVLDGIMDTSTIHIHRPGDTYIDNDYYPISEHYMDENQKWIFTSNEKLRKYYHLSPSGVYRLSNLLKLEQDALPKDKTIEKTTFRHKIGRKEEEITSYRISKEDFLASLEHAVYPRLKVDERKLDFYIPLQINKINEKYDISVSQLLEKYPGIHYQLLCRNVSPSCKKAALQRRMESAEMFQTVPSTFEKTVKANQAKNIESFFETFVQNKKRPIQVVSSYYEKLPPSAQTGKARFLYQRQLANEAKNQIEKIFEPHDFSIVKSTLDRIGNDSLLPFILEVEEKCKEEAKKTNGQKDSILQECLQDIHARKMAILKNTVLPDIFNSKEEIMLETFLNEFNQLLKSMSKEALERNGQEILDTIDSISLSKTLNNTVNGDKIATIYKRVLDKLKQYGVAWPNNKKGGRGKRKTRKQKRK